MRTSHALTLGLCLLCAIGAGERKDAAVRQVQASDAMGLWLQTQIMVNEERLGQPAPAFATARSATRPSARLPYSEAIKGALLYVDSGGAGSSDPGITQLSEDLLRQELTVLHQQNLQLYLRLNAQWDELAARGESAGAVNSPKDVAAAIERAVKSDNRVRSRPRGSLLEALKHSEQAAPDYSTASLASADARRAQSIEPPVPGRAKVEDVVAAVLSNQPIPDTFGVLSTLAPRNARVPGTAPLNGVSPRSFPMPAFAAGTTPFEAIAPGNPAAASPPPESVTYLASLTGLSSAEATAVLQGRLSLSEAMQRRGQGGEDQGALSASGMAPSAQDPRWQQFFYGTRQRQWQQTENTGFTFTPGGGRYDRSDTRVNRDPDLRLNGEIDRRVNTGHDRRINQQNDPRANY